MPKINVLPQHVAELIAAGEVVERPSSVVKELIENSVDAGAKRITVEIKNGGVRFIRISDDGCGISRDDIRNAFVSHATSKIKTGSDLDRITTLGFRGEALASVAAVARVETLTKTADEDIGTRYVIEGGKEKTCEDAGCPDGTTFIIRDIFYNTPARMKFLKKDSTEGNYVSDVVVRLALSHPGIAFSLIKDNKRVLSTSGSGSLKDTVYSVFGREFSSTLIECGYTVDSVSVSGFVSLPAAGRATRNMQHCFVNGRYVKIPSASSALDNAYKNSVMVGKFPSCVLFITVPPESVDVNVSPAKTEVRFSDERKIYEVIYYAALGAIRSNDVRNQIKLDKKEPINEFINRNKEPIKQTVMPENVTEVKLKIPEIVKSKAVSAENEAKPVLNGGFEFNRRKVNIDISAADEENITDIKNTKKPATAVTEAFERKNTEPAAGLTSPSQYAKLHEPDPPSYSLNDSETPDLISGYEKNIKNEETAEPAPLKTEDEKDAEDFSVIGEAFNTYIIAQTKKKLLFIDKHAAHERILFNELKKRGADSSSQLLLRPVTVTLSRVEYIAVTDNLDLFKNAGYAVEDFGEGCIVVRECPIDLSETDIADIITELAGQLMDGTKAMMPEKLDWLYHSTACRAAIKAGNNISLPEQRELVRRVLSDDDVRFCPHGRPVIIEMSEYELEKQFGRIQ